jgi:phosphoribosylglycinamide formyltransferase 2
VILASEEREHFSYDGIAAALALGSPGNAVDLRIFAKPKTLINRRMGIALARGDNTEVAVDRAKAAAARVRIRYED